MKITNNLKNKLEKAQSYGYGFLYCVKGSYKATTYIEIYPISDLLKKEIGINVGGGRPLARPGMWTGHTNMRDLPSHSISYTRLFKNF